MLRRYLAAAIPLLMCWATLAGSAAERSAAERPAAEGPAAGGAKYQKAIRAVYPALVRIKVVTPMFHDGREIRVQAGGSGVIISPDGHVVTNHHVAGKATRISCVLSDKQEIRAERVGTDALTDICVLKLVAKKRYPFARFGRSAALKVGDTVLAMGSPGSISQSVTAGVVSNVDLILPQFWRRLKLDGENVGSLVKWIAHDAAIFPGNSGGPLVSLRGEVVGINELGMGLGAAIPSDLAKSVVGQILEHGEPSRSSLGIVVQPLLKSAGRKRGALVSGVVAGTPAAKAGFKPGDVILSYDGKPVTVRFREDLPVFNRVICATPVGAKVKVVVERNGKERTLTITTGRRQKAMGETREAKEWGMAARDLTEPSAKAMKRESTDGVLVVNTRPGGPCAEAKPAIRAGDVIVEINRKPVKNVAALVAVTERTLRGKTEPVRTLVAFERKNEKWLTLVRVGIRDLPDHSPEARRAWLPASTQVLTTALAKELGLEGKRGIRLTGVFKGRSADKGGLRVGDIVTAIDGDPVRAFRPGDADVFPAMVRRRRVGQVVKLTVMRNGKQMTMPVKLERSPKATREMKRYRDVAFGFTVRDLSNEDRRTRKIEADISGPTVSEVELGSLAAVGGLSLSDIVISVDGAPTANVAALKKAMANVRKARPPRTVLFVKRAIYTLFVELETPWPAKD